MRRFFSKLVVVAAILAVPTAAWAGTKLANSCACGANCPCGAGCDCAH